MAFPENLASEPVAETESRGFGQILDRLGCCIERISLAFDRWDEAQVRGPGLYFVVARDSLEPFIEPMGTNRWPVEACPSVFVDDETLIQAARSVARSRDGAVVVHADGTFGAEMVRVAQPPTNSRDRFAGLPYAGWMGARHMSALETSAREAVAGAITLSEEDGRMTVFRNGDFQDYPRKTVLDGQGVCD